MVNQEIIDKYEIVVGLEVHAQMATNSKVFSSDSTHFGAVPNTNISVISLGHPGTLPKVNQKVIESAVKLGLATKSNITRVNEFARKNYFYADLPKGYQITQDTTPVCTGGYIDIRLEDDTEKRVNLTRIHIEEDAGKSMHDQDPKNSLIDLNRAGVPLLEIVSEPEMRSGEEAYQYLTEVRKIVRYLEICDGNMDEGSMRCDANVSVRIKGTKEFGNRCEVKNMNSIRNVQRAIEHEAVRQIEIIEAGGVIKQQTRSFDATNGTTFTLRSKEMADDYRYFPEPDLPPVIIEKTYIDEVKSKMPALPDELYNKYVNELKLSAYNARNITDQKKIALYYEKLIALTDNYKGAANWLLTQVKSYLNDKAIAIDQFPITPTKLVELIKLIDDGKVSNSVATQQIFPEMCVDTKSSPIDIAKKMNLIQESDTDSINLIVQEVLAKNPVKVAEYKSGKKGLLGMFMGEVMKASKGKADPKVASELVQKALED